MFLLCCCGNKLPQAGWVKQHTLVVLHLEIKTAKSTFMVLKRRCGASGSHRGYFGGSEHMTKPVLFPARAPGLQGTALSMAHLHPVSAEMGSVGAFPWYFGP